MTIHLIRHGPVKGKSKAIYGWTDIEPLDAPQIMIDRLQIRFDLKTLKSIYSSDLQRCRLPAETIANQYELPLMIHKHLREQHFGEWEGMTWDEVKDTDPIQWKHFFDDYLNHSAPNGESFLQLHYRIQSIWNEIMNSTQPALVVGHAGPIRIMKSLNEKISLEKALLYQCQHYDVFELNGSIE